MNFRSAGVWAHLPNWPRSNWKRSLRTKRRQTKVQERFRSKWRMARMSLIQILPVQSWAPFSTQSTTNLNTSVLMRRSGCWMRIRFTNQQMTVFQATNIQFQACRELSFWHTRSGPSGSLWGDEYGMLICQEHWWPMKWVLERLSPRLQQQCFANCCLRKVSLGCYCPIMGEYPGRVGDSGGQWLSWHCQWRTGVVSAPGIEFGDPPPVGDPDNTTAQASSIYIGPWTNLGSYNARSGRDYHDCHRRDDTWNRFQTHQLVAGRKC